MILGSLSSPFLAAYIHSYLYAYTMPRKIVAQHYCAQHYCVLPVHGANLCATSK